MKENRKQTYHIYGRTAYPEPLAFITAVTVAVGEEPTVPAGEDWVEVVAFLDTAVIQVIPHPKEKAT